MSPYFQKGDLLIDKVENPYLIGLIDEIEYEKGNIIYKCICPESPTGKLWWKEECVIDGLMDGTTEVRRVRH